MALHPAIQALLDQSAEAGQPPLWEMGPEAGREAYAFLHSITDPTDAPIGKVVNSSFDGPGGEVPVRIYTPVAAGGTTQVILFFHGGGFVIGGLDSHDGLCRNLANDSGCTVVAVDYRLAPEHPFPAAIDDAIAALHWVEENASSLGVDANGIAVAGDSAGGNISAVLAQYSKHTRHAPHVCFQLLIYPAVRVGSDTDSMKEFEDGYILNRKNMAWFMKNYVPEGTDTSDPRLSPMLADDVSGLAPAYVVTAHFDPLRDEGKAYADRLSEAGVPVTYKHYDDMVHGFFNMTNLDPAIREAVKEAAQAVRDAWAD